MSAPSHSGSGDGPGTRVGNLNPCLQSCLGFLVADRTDSRLGGNPLALPLGPSPGGHRGRGRRSGRRHYLRLPAVASGPADPPGGLAPVWLGPQDRGLLALGRGRLIVATSH